MQEKPKTLKDIFPEGSPGILDTAFKEVLRAEAVKWVRSWTERRKNTTRSGVKKDTGAITAFKVFFNLTEEDLKGGNEEE